MKNFFGVVSLVVLVGAIVFSVAEEPLNQLDNAGTLYVPVEEGVPYTEVNVKEGSNWPSEPPSPFYPVTLDRFVLEVPDLGAFEMLVRVEMLTEYDAMRLETWALHKTRVHAAILERIKEYGLKGLDTDEGREKLKADIAGIIDEHGLGQIGPELVHFDDMARIYRP